MKTRYSYHYRQTKAKQTKKPFEVRADSAIAYPHRNHPNSWAGVIRLSRTGQLYWLGISRFFDEATDGHYYLRLTVKGVPQAKPSCAQLLPASGLSTGPFTGTLILGGTPPIKYRVSMLALEQSGDCYLRLHFEAQNQGEEGK
jgi:hypothetical protein